MIDYDKVPDEFKLIPQEITRFGELCLCRYAVTSIVMSPVYVSYEYIVEGRPPLYTSVGLFKDFEDAAEFASIINTEFPTFRALCEKKTELTYEEKVIAGLVRQIRRLLNGYQLTVGDGGILIDDYWSK